MKIYQFSSLARALDPNYPTNRAILLLSLLIALAATLIRGFHSTMWMESARWGAGAGLMVFFSWALCRELDPDHELAAFVAAGLACLGTLTGQLPDLLSALWLLLIVRVLNRSSGLAATWWDSLTVLGLAAWLTLRGGWGYALVTAAALLLDGRMRPTHARQVALAGFAGLATGFAILLDAADRDMAIGAGLLGLAISALFLPVVLRSGDLESVGDRTGERLRGSRVQAAQAVALLAGVQLAFWGGSGGLILMSPLWAAVLGAWAYWAGGRLWRAARRQS